MSKYQSSRCQGGLAGLGIRSWQVSTVTYCNWFNCLWPAFPMPPTTASCSSSCSNHPKPAGKCCAHISMSRRNGTVLPMDHHGCPANGMAWTWRSTWRSTWKCGFNPTRKYESHKISHTKSMIIIHHHPTYEGNKVRCQPATPIRFATFINQFRSFRNRTKRSLSPPSYDKYDRRTWWPADNDLLSSDLSLTCGTEPPRNVVLSLCASHYLYYIYL